MHAVTTPGGHRYVPRLRDRIVAMLKFMGRHGADLPVLIDYCYGDQTDGGPLHCADTIGHTISALRRAGLAIERAGRGRYVLAPPPAPARRPNHCIAPR